MGQVSFDYSKTEGYVHAHEVESMKAITESAKELLLSKKGAGNDFLGWIDLPVDYDKDEFERIKKAAKKIQESDIKFSEELEKYIAKSGLISLKSCLNAIDLLSDKGEK